MLTILFNQWVKPPRRARGGGAHRRRQPEARLMVEEGQRNEEDELCAMLCLIVAEIEATRLCHD